jgi:hypothetical protein
MWWKLMALLMVTTVVILGIIPMHTHAIFIDPIGPPPPPATFETMIGSMYLTPTVATEIVVILCAAAAIGVQIIRKSRF